MRSGIFKRGSGVAVAARAWDLSSDWGDRGADGEEHPVPQRSAGSTSTWCSGAGVIRERPAVPHPRLRAAVVPAAGQLAPRFLHPVLRRTMARLLAEQGTSERCGLGVGGMNLAGRHVKLVAAKGNYIVIEGPIGVGKTSLVNLLAKRFSAKKILEAADENPFLPQFYDDKKRHAFQTQLFFLLSRFRQQQELAQQDLFQQFIVADYLFDRDRIFAYLNLDDNELALYEQIYGLLKTKITVPDVVIYLQASTDVLVERIARRNRAYEKHLSRQYLEELNQAYNYFFFHYSATPLLVINTNVIDFVQNPIDLDDLATQILHAKRGTEYYTPARSVGKR
jgi:deoxyadenosine/deoxycytidine kinase